jgi:hypothetical protein
MSALDGKVAQYRCFTPRKEPTGTKWVGSWVIPKAGLKYALHCPQNVLNIAYFVVKYFKAYQLLRFERISGKYLR